MYNLSLRDSGFYSIKCFGFSDYFLLTDYSTYIRFVDYWKSLCYVSHISIKKINNLGYEVVKVCYTPGFTKIFGVSTEIIAYSNPNAWR